MYCMCYPSFSPKLLKKRIVSKRSFHVATCMNLTFFNQCPVFYIVPASWWVFCFSNFILLQSHNWHQCTGHPVNTNMRVCFLKIGNVGWKGMWILHFDGYQLIAFKKVAVPIYVFPHSCRLMIYIDFRYLQIRFEIAYFLMCISLILPSLGISS